MLSTTTVELHTASFLLTSLKKMTRIKHMYPPRPSSWLPERAVTSSDRETPSPMSSSPAMSAPRSMPPSAPQTQTPPASATISPSSVDPSSPTPPPAPLAKPPGPARPWPRAFRCAASFSLTRVPRDSAMPFIPPSRDANAGVDPTLPSRGTVPSGPMCSGPTTRRKGEGCHMPMTSCAKLTARPRLEAWPSDTMTSVRLT
mmetsp:Transcript_41780/g.97830  ORF Transcript_41780/g.97830 Transcript_41780/m.97830 type:complete len:201 (+) Transcript_41780:1123-1725(+)